jgi:hypothetical protein
MGELGNRLKRIGNEGALSKTRKKHDYKYGTITQIKKVGGADCTPFIKVRWQDTSKESDSWLILEDHPLMIALCFSATLEDLVGYRVRVELNNYSSARGLARIVGDEVVEIMNYDPQLESTGIKLA